MHQQHMMIRTIARAGWLVGFLLAFSFLSLLLLSNVTAQETDTVIRIEIDAEQPVPDGQEFEARVVVDDVEHLAGFDFTIAYDPERVRPVERELPEGAPTPADGSFNVEVDDVGEFLLTNGERQDLICNDPTASESATTIIVTCNTLGPPLCLEGPPGASGSGVLGRLLFESRGGELTTLELTSSTLVLDDVDSCDPEELHPVEILHRREDASVALSGGGGDAPVAAIIAGIAVAVVVVVGGGVAGRAWYQRRGTAS